MQPRSVSNESKESVSPLIGGTYPTYQTQVSVSHSSSDDDDSSTSDYRYRRSRMQHWKKAVYIIFFALVLIVAACKLFSPFLSASTTSTPIDSPQQDQEQDQHLDAASSVTTDEPLSLVSPQELNIPNYNDRPDSSRPSQVFASVQQGAAIEHPLPTNGWFINLLVGLNYNEEDDAHFTSGENRVYTIPYVVDTVGTVVGIRLHFPHVLCWGTGVQSSFVDRHGLTLGTADELFPRRYTVDEETLPNKLGVGIRWVSLIVLHETRKRE